MSFQNPDDSELRALLERARTIALVGASPKPDRPAHGIMQVDGKLKRLVKGALID